MAEGYKEQAATQCCGRGECLFSDPSKPPRFTNKTNKNTKDKRKRKILKSRIWNKVIIARNGQTNCKSLDFFRLNKYPCRQPSVIWQRFMYLAHHRSSSSHYIQSILMSRQRCIGSGAGNTCTAIMKCIITRNIGSQFKGG